MQASPRPIVRLTLIGAGSAPVNVATLGMTPVVVGRDAGCDVVIDDTLASRRHAEFRLGEDGQISVTDLGSSNGTFVDGRRIAAVTTVAPGAEIRIGDTRIGLNAVVGPAIAGPEPAASRRQSPSLIERIDLRRSVKRANRVALAAVFAAVGAIILGALGLGGFLPGQAKPPTIASVVAQAAPSTVYVLVPISAELSGAGSGWVYDASKGLIVTNNHVVAGAATISVANGPLGHRVATILATAPCEDLAVLQLADTSGLVGLPLGSQDQVQAGDQVVALGYPASLAPSGMEVTATTGIVSVTRQAAARSLAFSYPSYSNLIQTDAAINPGNSGGPLLNLRGQLIGVNTLYLPSQGGRAIESQGYAIGVDRVKTEVADLANGLSHGRISAELESIFALGSTAQEIQAALAGHHLPAHLGLLVTKVSPGGSADHAGFTTNGTLITAIDGKAIDGTLPSYCDAAAGKAKGQTATFTVYMAGQSTPTDIVVTFD